MLLMLAFVLLSILLIVRICKSKWNEWNNPILLICMLYALLTIVALFGLQSYQWYYEGIIWLTIALWCLTFGGLFGSYLFFYRNPALKYSKNIRAEICIYFIPSNIAWYFLIVLIALGILGWVYQVYYNGFSLNDFGSVDSLASMNNSIAVERYSGQTKSNFIIKIASIIDYLSPLCGGFLFPYAKTLTKKRICAISLLPIVLVMLFSNGKSGFISSIILYIGAYFISYLYMHKDAPAIKIKRLVACLILGVLLVLLLLITMMLRIGRVDVSTFEVVTDKFMIYAFGEIQAFDYWFSTQNNHYQYSAGVQTFMSIFDTLGIVDRVQGVYELIPNAQGNVFTVFRGIIEDFGKVGGLLFINICGNLIGYNYERIKVARHLPIFSCLIVISMLFFFAFGYIISPWVYATYVVTFLGFAIFLKICNLHHINIVIGKKLLLK